MLRKMGKMAVNEVKSQNVLAEQLSSEIGLAPPAGAEQWGRRAAAAVAAPVVGVLLQKSQAACLRIDREIEKAILANPQHRIEPGTRAGKKVPTKKRVPAG